MTAIPHPFHGTHEDTHDHAHAHEHHLPFLGKYLFSTDHKVIGIQFLFLGLVFMALGGLLAMIVRWQLGWPDNPTQGSVGKALPILGKWLGWQDGKMPADFYYMA